MSEFPKLMRSKLTGDLVFFTDNCQGMRVHCPGLPDILGRHSDFWVMDLFEDYEDR